MCLCNELLIILHFARGLAKFRRGGVDSSGIYAIISIIHLFLLIELDLYVQTLTHYISLQVILKIIKSWRLSREIRLQFKLDFNQTRVGLFGPCDKRAIRLVKGDEINNSRRIKREKDS
jgi:hypothetical protein